MDVAGWLIFLAAVFTGSYVQSVTGFAMGMIVIAVVGASGVISLPVLTAAASLITMVNVVVALQGHTRHIDWRIFLLLGAGQIPAIGFGVWLLTQLDREAQWLLELLLGSFITLGSLSMMLRPHPLKQVSPSWACLGAGIAGGVVGGMFSASGPIIGWFNYRQPLGLVVIRATLLCSFALTTTTRTIVVGAQGGLTADVLWLSLVAIPLVVLGTWLGRELPPPVSETTMKRLAFGLLLIMGVWIVFNALR
ncbi:MAG: TSUP family transporter [Pseudomonadales bacterium]